MLHPNTVLHQSHLLLLSLAGAPGLHAHTAVRLCVPYAVHRGQLLPAGAAAPVFGPSAQVDFELEVVST